MSWRDKLQWARGQMGKASFRGCAFFIEDAETQVGRRTEIKYASTNASNNIDSLLGIGKPASKSSDDKDDVWAEDLGADADEFQITGYVIQNLDNGFDHFPERDKLISACKTEGPGTLIHPSFGMMQVSLKERARITESFTKELGIARFEMVFVQYKKPVFQKYEVDYDAYIDASVLGTINAALDGFTALMRTSGSFLSTLTAPITKTMNKIQGAINATKGAVASTIATALGTIRGAILLVNSLLNSPCDLAKQLIAAGQAAKALVGMAGQIVQGGIIGGCSGENRGNTVILSGNSCPETLGVSVCEQLADNANYNESDLNESISTEQSNNLSLAVTVSQIGMLTTACQIAIRILFTNQETMEALIQKILLSLDNLINRLGSVDGAIDDPLLFTKVSQLRSDFVDSMYKKNTNLAKQISYEVPTAVQSTILLAYDQYGNIERESEIFERNKILIRHPGFLPSGQEIQILNV